MKANKEFTIRFRSDNTEQRVSKRELEELIITKSVYLVAITQGDELLYLEETVANQPSLGTVFLLDRKNRERVKSYACPIFSDYNNLATRYVFECINGFKLPWIPTPNP